MDEEDLAPFEGETCDLTDIPCHMSSFAEWLLDLLLFVPRKVFEQITESVGNLLNAIPAPSWMADASNAFSSVPPHVAFFIDFLALDYGAGIILSAYGLRFLIRRIPVIG